MDRKLIVVTTVIGSFVGGYIPSLWNADMFSVSGIIFSAIGGIIGMWIGYKISQ